MRAPLFIIALLLSIPTAARAQEQTVQKQSSPVAIGASVGRTIVDSDSGDARGLRLELGLGGHASIRFDLGQTDFNSQRRDRRAGATLSLDVTDSLRIGQTLTLTPHLDVGLGATGSDRYILDAIDVPVSAGYDWRPHGEVGAGARFSLGRAALDLGVATGIRRRSIQLQVASDDGRLSSFFGSGNDRERYTSYQLSALVAF